MPIKVIPINNRKSFNCITEQNDCIVLRLWGKDAQVVEMSFPFHEDTQNMDLTIPEALNLRNAIDQLIDLKMLEKPRGK